MSYSPNLSYFLDRLSGFSTNIFRLETNGADTATANKIVRFSLPSNALLNMRSFALHFNATTNNGNGARLPAKIDTLIERVEVTAGGIQLSQGLNMYNVLRHAKDALTGSKTNSVCGHPEIVRTKSYVDGSTIGAGTDGESYPSTNKQAQFIIDHWEGFIGTCEPKILDAAILPDLVISIYLADNNVLSSSGDEDIDVSFNVDGAGAATYTLNNIHATIESIGLADAVYDNMVSSMIAQKGYVEVPFKQYISFNNTHTGSTRFSVATQSLDRIWVAFRDTGYAYTCRPTSRRQKLSCHRTFRSKAFALGARTLNVYGLSTKQKILQTSRCSSKSSYGLRAPVLPRVTASGRREPSRDVCAFVYGVTRPFSSRLQKPYPRQSVGSLVHRRRPRSPPVSEEVAIAE